MKQKLAVARAVLHRPDLVFLDEPTSGLDPVATAGLREDLAALAAQEGVTVFLTTHNLNEAERLCAQVGVIRGGKLLAVGSPESLRARRDSGRVDIVATGLTEESSRQSLPPRPDVRVSDGQCGSVAVSLSDGASVAPIVAWLVQHDVAIEEVRKARATLEDAFLDLMGAEIENGEGRRRHDVIARHLDRCVEGVAGVPRSAALAAARRSLGADSRVDSRRRGAGAARRRMGRVELIIGYWPFLAATMVSSLIADSVAGERERHTLETLLASRLSDSAILIGKIIAAVLYGVGFAVANLVIGLIAVNVAHGENGLILFEPQRFVVTIVLTILASLLMAGIGVFISLRASTVKQAQQAFGIAIIVLTMGPLLLFNALSYDTRDGAREPPGSSWRDANRGVCRGRAVRSVRGCDRRRRSRGSSEGSSSSTDPAIGRLFPRLSLTAIFTYATARISRSRRDDPRAPGGIRGDGAVLRPALRKPLERTPLGARGARSAGRSPRARGALSRRARR